MGSLPCESSYARDTDGGQGIVSHTLRKSFQAERIGTVLSISNNITMSTLIVPV